VPTLGDIVFKIRSKNAGPFWVTIDIFCGSRETFNAVRAALSVGQVAALVGQSPDLIREFAIPDLNVIKYSLPRPCVQGSRFDRDMHGAQTSVLLSELEINAS